MQLGISRFCYTWNDRKPPVSAKAPEGRSGAAFLKMNSNLHRRSSNRRLPYPIKRFHRIALPISLVLLLAGGFSAQSPTTFTNAGKRIAPEAELIHYGDLVDVDFVGSVEYDWRGSVNPEGFLDGLEMASEPIFALCKSEDAVAAEIAKQYSRILRDPKVVVKVIDRSGRAVTVMLGAVRNEQRFSIKREARLSELLALSGGITENASGEVTIFRPGNLNCIEGDASGSAKSKMIDLTLAKLLAGDPDSNPVVFSGDIITVVEASPIYVLGGVNNPRQISTKGELTLSHAIASAGGLAREAVETDITVFRRDSHGTKSLSADLSKIRSNQQEDLKLQPFDIIEVGEKDRAKPKYPPAVDTAIEKRNLYKLPIRPIE
jgi:protein involved in polysaccharide export with SLBB domain